MRWLEPIEVKRKERTEVSAQRIKNNNNNRNNHNCHSEKKIIEL